MNTQEKEKYKKWYMTKSLNYVKDLAITKSQLLYYFKPKYLKHFEPDLYCDLGNAYFLHLYSVEKIKIVMLYNGIKLRKKEEFLHSKRIVYEVYDYLDDFKNYD